MTDAQSRFARALNWTLWSIMTPEAYSHPHPNPRHIRDTYRQHILSAKRKYGSARGLIHYRAILIEYLAAKRRLLAERARKGQ